MKCPKCGALIQAGQTQCLKCGARFKTQQCPRCGADILSNLAECPRCGKRLKPAAQNAPQDNAGAKRPLTRRWWFWALCALFTLGIIGNIGRAMAGGEKSPAASSSAATTAVPELDGAESAEGTAATPEPMESADAVKETNAFLAPEVQVGDVMNGTRTNKLGEYAYIEMKKADALSASPDDFNEFLSKRVNNSGYNWWSIAFEDGTGVNFPASQTMAGSYGEMDFERTIPSPAGDIILEIDGRYTYTKRDTSSYSEPSHDTPAGNSNNFNTYENPDQQQTGADYVLNTSSRKFHYPSCDDVQKIAPKNYSEFFGTKDEVMSAGYSPCGHCDP